MSDKMKHFLPFAWTVSLLATSGSLYFSEVAKFIPCQLCWFQRIFMYPLVILLGIAVVKKDQNIISYAMPLSIIGWIISSYHILVQKVPGFAEITPCVQGVACNIQYINWFGFVTIPVLAWIAFACISIFLWLERK